MHVLPGYDGPGDRLGVAFQRCINDSSREGGGYNMAWASMTILPGASEKSTRMKTDEETMFGINHALLVAAPAPPVLNISLVPTCTGGSGSGRQCAADFGNSTPCCGQGFPPVPQWNSTVTVKYRCPADAPTCEGYKHGSHFGSCTGHNASASHCLGGRQTLNGSGTSEPVSLGDIRAVVHAATAGQPIQAQIWWRRRDAHPELKAVIVTDANNKPLPAVALHVSSDCGVVRFTPPAAGLYHVYYLPFVQSGGNAHTHFHWYNCSDKGSTPANKCVIRMTDVATGCDSVDAEATARVLRLESRSSPLPLQQPADFDAFHPMELTATATELASLRKSAARPFQVFLEPRFNAVRMFDRVPASWAKGEAHALSLTAVAGEYLTFQIGLWASDGPITGVTLDFSPLMAAGGAPAIPAADFMCFNLGGSDPHGQRFKKNYTVARDKVGSKWIGVQLPPDVKAVGSYSATLTLRASGAKVPLKLSVLVALGRRRGRRAR